jgi:SAM-dependent methyltransferase
MSAAPYDDPRAWADGPDLVYGRLAAAAADLLDLGGRPAGRLVLDAGTGTGAFARALGERGAGVVAVDASPAMLSFGRAGRPPALAGDLCALPLRDGCVDAAVAGFVLSHVPDPVLALAELARVMRPGGPLLATSFLAGPGTVSHPAKAALDRVLDECGYRPPGWYTALKGAGEERVGAPAALLAVAADAGLTRPRVHELAVSLAGLDADALMRWRLGMAQVAPWLAALGEARRAEVRAAGRTALAGIATAPLPMLVLHARA